MPDRRPSSSTDANARKPASVNRCPAHLRAQALTQLAAAQQQESLNELVEAVQTCQMQPERAWDGLLVPTAEKTPIAAAWVQSQPGNTARLWLPRPDSSWATPLVHHAIERARTADYRILQAVIDSKDQAAAQLLQTSGLAWLVDLLYMGAETSAQPPLTASAQQQAPYLEPVGALPSPRLEALMAKIEQGSLDCPQLQGALTPAQAVTGFQHQGRYIPEQWLILRVLDQDAGALLLTAHPEAECWELMYMGITPDWRGQALGRLLVQQALGRAHADGAKLLLLSVDKQNQPAIEHYKNMGFQPYAQRSLFTWFSEQARADRARRATAQDDTPIESA